ncbi:MAG: hypothetical protein FVQ80_14035 [Planctomycetes bacterium]|nr:hypothetical protein [Planctomycetota bacterium]
MTISEMIQKYPNAAQAIFDSGYTAGQVDERKAWEARLLTEEETGRVADEMFREVFAPEHCEPEGSEDSKI